VPAINLKFSNCTSFELSKKAEKVEITYKKYYYEKYTKYQIGNIYNPRVRFAFYIEECDDGPINIIIRKMKE